MKDSLYLNTGYVDLEGKHKNVVAVICITVVLLSVIAFIIETYFFKTNFIQNFALFGIGLTLLILFLMATSHSSKKVSRDLVNDLIDNENKDDRLTNTIREIYRLRGEILVYDLIKINRAVHLELQKFYDDKIKTGVCNEYTEEQASLMVNTEKLLIKVLENIQPKKAI